MIRILITGESSYIGNKFKEWVDQWPTTYLVDFTSVRGEEWKRKSWNDYDVLIHVAGLAHKKENEDIKKMHYLINRDLSIEVAKKAINANINHFIYISSMSIYGDSVEKINSETVPNPSSAYGKSKLQAENIISELILDSQKLSIIRPPMVYGNGAKGNYRLLAKFANYFPIFPNFNNKRSMIFIDNLSELIRLIVDNKSEGIFLPQNDSYVNTATLFEQIRKAHEKKTVILNRNKNKKSINFKVKVLRKLFGNLYYDLDQSNYFEGKYVISGFEESIEKTEL